MVKRKLIHVTQEDIDNGEPYSCGRCPIALATIRELKISPQECYEDGSLAYDSWANLYVYVTFDYILVIRNEHGLMSNGVMFNGSMNKTSRQFIQAFDHGELVKPFNFYAVER